MIRTYQRNAFNSHHFVASGSIVLALTLILTLVLNTSMLHQEAAASLAASGPGGTKFSFAAHFVCGFQPVVTNQVGEPLVKPGNYATTITIHNFNYITTTVTILKKVLVLAGTTTAGQSFVIREPQTVQPPSTFASVTLVADGATLDDCNALWAMAGLPAGSLTIGYLVILSPLNLDVNAVYTAEVPGTPGSTPSGISENEVTVTGRSI